MEKHNIFLNEYIMKTASIVVAVGNVVMMIIMWISGDLTSLDLFEGIVEAMLAIGLYWTFAHYRWDFMRGLMGAMLFALIYQEAFHVLGQLWADTADFDAYLIMGLDGSIYLAAYTMSFMMTVIIIVNHFILEYSKLGNRANMFFNQMSILFKIILYIMLLVVNFSLELQVKQMIYTGIGYVTDLAIIIILICIESQLDEFKELRNELKKAKKAGGE